MIWLATQNVPHMKDQSSRLTETNCNPTFLELTRQLFFRYDSCRNWCNETFWRPTGHERAFVCIRINLAQTQVITSYPHPSHANGSPQVVTHALSTATLGGASFGFSFAHRSQRVRVNVSTVNSYPWTVVKSCQVSIVKLSRDWHVDIDT